MKSFMMLFNLLFVSLLAFNCSGRDARTPGRQTVLLGAGDVHNGWYFAGGAQVDMDGTVNGDAFIAGGVVNIRGTVNGLLAVAGGEVNLTGTVTDRIICTGGVLRISGRTGKSLFAGGGSVILERGATVGEYLMAGGSEVQIRGVVARDAKIGAGDLNLTGEIQGDLDAGVEEFSAEAGSTVGGNLTVMAKDSDRVHIAPGTVRGEIHMKAGKEAQAPRTLGLTTGQIVMRILFFLSLCFTALVLSFVLPRSISSVGTIIDGRPGESVLYGLVSLLLVPLLVIVLILTVIGIPLGLFFFFYLCWLAYLSQMALGIFLGCRIFGFDGKSGWGLFGSIAAGMLIVHIGTYIPFVNVIIMLGGLILGVGALAIITQEQFLILRSR